MQMSHCKVEVAVVLDAAATAIRWVKLYRRRAWKAEISRLMNRRFFPHKTVASAAQSLILNESSFGEPWNQGKWAIITKARKLQKAVRMCTCDTVTLDFNDTEFISNWSKK
jgi:hypothetical protein